MKRTALVALFSLVLMVVAGVILAELQMAAPSVSLITQRTIVSVVCLQAGFPTSAQVSVAQIDAAGNVLAGTEVPPVNLTSGFAFFQVIKGKNYRFTAVKERRGFRVTPLAGSQNVMSVSGMTFIPIYLSEEQASAAETSINVIGVGEKGGVFRDNRISVGEIGGAPGSAQSTYTRDGFATFRVLKNRNYRVSAIDEYRPPSGVPVPGRFRGNEDLLNVRSAQVVQLVMKLPEADVQGTGGVALDEYNKTPTPIAVPPTVRALPTK